ncbi:GPI ethanolamine phosphate transferase 3 isoform X2 [Anoplophora glabripennis]|uniref:GPI ethanolamine phosphate transferase 3 isoform X2 n=1 Tax=Anoplophora glabripennis TaxID=217634 RepID=UPI0008751732|nr:GPI ethanolamine phosphate transferase 3 isoform X2 [Anoplophora glabripennis]
MSMVYLKVLRGLYNNMARVLYYFFFILWLCYLIVSSIFLFTQGFLLTRVVQNNNASCLPLNDVICTPILNFNIKNDSEESCSQGDKISTVLKNYETTTTTICLPARAKVVLLIVDALRYDFTIFNEKNKYPLPFQNKLPVIDKLCKKYPDYTRLYKFIADPPTTTMQRIKGLTTGSFPTFIDAGSNFATMEISEDNIIDQLFQHEKYQQFAHGDYTRSPNSM